jgi:hypothetical protein
MIVYTKSMIAHEVLIIESIKRFGYASFRVMGKETIGENENRQKIKMFCEWYGEVLQIKEEVIK